MLMQVVKINRFKRQLDGNDEVVNFFMFSFENVPFLVAGQIQNAKQV